MPERRRVDIECHRQILRLFLFQYLKHNVQKSIDRIGMQSLRIRQVRETIKRPVQNTVSINQYNLTHAVIPFCTLSCCQRGSCTSKSPFWNQKNLQLRSQ